MISSCGNSVEFSGTSRGSGKTFIPISQIKENPEEPGTALSQQAIITWKWFCDKTCNKQNSGVEDEEANEIVAKPLVQNQIQISSSMPNLAEEFKPTYVQEIKDIVIKKDGGTKWCWTCDGLGATCPKSTLKLIKNIHIEVMCLEREAWIHHGHDFKVIVLRQTTLPIVSERHQTFHRQYSHALNMNTEIKFSICSLDKNYRSSKIGIIQPELYKNELQRQSSIKNEVKMVTNGFLHFALKYDTELEGLVVKVFEARNLPIKDTFGTCDAYVKLHLLPDRKKKYQTKVHRKSLSPVFNETFIFSATSQELETRFLQLSVYDFDRFTRHDLIGHVTVNNLTEVVEHRQDCDYSMPILCQPVDEVNLGELMVCLCFLPKAGRLTVTIVKGRNFKAMDIVGKSDPYVKVYLIWNGRKIKKKKTTVRTNTLFPLFNEALVFDVPEENIAEVSLLVKVLDYDRVGHNEVLGCFTTGPANVGKGRDHWQQMLENPRKPIAQWYSLMESEPAEFSSDKESTILLKCLKSR